MQRDGLVTNACLDMSTRPGESPVTAGMVRVGRKAAGRMLDGRTHDELAWPRSRAPARRDTLQGGE